MHEFSKFLFVLSLVRVCHDIHVTYTQCYQKYLAIQLSPTFHNRERKKFKYRTFFVHQALKRFERSRNAEIYKSNTQKKPTDSPTVTQTDHKGTFFVMPIMVHYPI